MEPSVGFSWILEPNLLQVEMGWTVRSSLPPWALWVMEAIATPSWLYSPMACSYIEQHSRVSYVFKGPRLRITPAGASGLGDGKAYFVCTGFLSPLYAGGPSRGSSARFGTEPQWSLRAGSNSSVVILSPSPWNLPTVS